MDLDGHRFEYALRLGDNCLILAQRVSAWVGHAPVLEEDIGLANVALDMVGQCRLWLELAGEIEGTGRSADDLAFRRDSAEFRNLLLVEQPNGDFAHTLVRQFLFDCWHLKILEGLAASSDPRFAEIAEKASKEAAYHVSRGNSLVIGLGDGTDESHDRMQTAFDDLWPYTGEMFAADETDEALQEAGIAPSLEDVRSAWDAHMSDTLKEATLVIPDPGFAHKGGKSGIHTENLGYILAEMQFLQRAYPDAVW